MFKLLSVMAVFIVTASFPGIADEKKMMKPVPAPQIFETAHQSEINGKKVSYKAIAGERHLKNDEGEAIASIFSVTYLRTDIKNTEKRPVIFVFNGGPGSSSVWLHMGLYGPKHIVLPSDARDDGAAPYLIKDNPQSLLDQADLVFIDPVGTGYSRAVGAGKNEDFWGVKEDANSVAEFIRLWLGEHGRWNSPKYLSGESYGTTRAAALLDTLSGGWTDISVNGIMLISSVLDFQTSRYQPGNDTPYLSYLPTMAAAAWHHGKIDKNGRSLETFLNEVREFTLGEYASALLQGNRLNSDDFEEIVMKLSSYIGLKPHYIKNANLRINNIRFMKELLRDEGYTIGRLDARFKGKDYEGTGERFDNDPSAYGIDSSYSASLNHYLGTDLGVKIERRYEILSGKPGSKWKGIESGSYSGGYVNVAPNVGRAMRENNDFKVFVANGYFDLATPFFATENTMNANGIDTDRVTFTYYPAGHMMYIHHPSLDALANDVRSFLKPE